MQFNRDKHHRRSIRLRDYDYTQNGAYFVTICTFQKESLFGKISDDGEMVLNACGRIVEHEWLQTSILRTNVELDAFVVMPNHIHGIVVIRNVLVGARRALPLQHRTSQPVKFGQPATGSLGIIVGAFKAAASKRVISFLNISGSSLWQRNYHEKIIRNESMLNSLRQYIETNPSNWAFDEDNIVRKRS